MLGLSLIFQSTPPVWGATLYHFLLFLSFEFQSTPPVWGATFVYFRCTQKYVFQSTPPVWGATCSQGFLSHKKIFQSTPPVWGATLWLHWDPQCGRISIHAPRVGGDASNEAEEEIINIFQSTPPVWGATGQFHRHRPTAGISIHAPRVGGDTFREPVHGHYAYFNPRPPCGGRRPPGPWVRPPMRFQSTPPVWGATRKALSAGTDTAISIHAPRVGGDIRGPAGSRASCHFNPRPPCGGRLSPAPRYR